MSKMGWAIRIGGYVGAPFTGGWSIPAANTAASLIEKKQASNDKPKAGDPTAQLGNFLQEGTAARQSAMRGANELGDLSSQGVLPVLDYLRAIVGGDPGQLMSATQPERGLIMDQYDAGRKAIAAFSPRGGGTTSALANSYIGEANQLGDVLAGARTKGVETLGNLGLQLGGQAINMQQLASMDLHTLIGALLQQRGQDIEKRGQTMNAWTGIGQAAGTFIGDWLNNRGGGGGGGNI